MFGNKANDGFLDGLARAIYETAIWLSVFVIIWYIIDDFIQSIRFGRWGKVIKHLIVYFCIYMFTIMALKQEENWIKQDDPHTPSGQELWNERMNGN